MFRILAPLFVSYSEKKGGEQVRVQSSIHIPSLWLYLKILCIQNTNNTHSIHLRIVNCNDSREFLLELREENRSYIVRKVVYQRMNEWDE